MPYEFVLWAHASAVALALALFIVSEALLILARRDGASGARIALVVSKIAGMAAGLGVLGGITLVYLGSWPLTTPWLIASLVLIALLMAISRIYVSPWEARMKLAIGNRDASNINILANDVKARTGRVGVIALFIAVALLMAFKPEIPLLP